MPLDTGAFSEVDSANSMAVRRPRVTLDPNLDLGAGLKAARESLGLTLDDVARTTRVRIQHLAAIEALDVPRLPSRPFAIGYVRAYAKELGLDADAASARFRAETPNPDDELHSPLGVNHGHAGRNRTLMLAAGVIVLAVVAWNLTRHGVASAPTRSLAAQVRIAPPRAAGPFTAAAPLPAPAEATNPDPYETPGLPAANAAGGSANAADAAVKAAAAAPIPAAPQTAAPVAFVAQGTVYGPTTGASGLIIQAIKPISLEVRGPNKVVYFARQLAAGEAYRVPALPGLTAEVSNPASAELFVAGVSKGPFPQAQLPLKVSG